MGLFLKLWVEKQNVGGILIPIVSKGGGRGLGKMFICLRGSVVGSIGLQLGPSNPIEQVLQLGPSNPIEQVQAPVDGSQFPFL